MNSHTPRTSDSQGKSFIRGGVWQTLFLLALLVYLLPIGQIFLPLLLLAVLCLIIYAYVRAAFYIGKRTGLTAVTLLIAVVAYTLIVQFRAFQSHNEFVQSLSQFDAVTVQTHSVLPSTPIQQISLEKYVSDADLKNLVSMPRLQNVSHVFLKHCDVTDSGLQLLDRWPLLTYLYIESSVISDEAIIEFKQLHPECSVIPPGRELW